MKYTVEIVPGAERDFRKLSPRVQSRIRRKLLALEEAPRPRGTKRLRGTDYYRIRVGDYRIVYSIDDKNRLLRILSIGHRREVYR